MKIVNAIGIKGGEFIRPTARFYSPSSSIIQEIPLIQFPSKDTIPWNSFEGNTPLTEHYS